jgi:hypothetical protein
LAILGERRRHAAEEVLHVLRDPNLGNLEGYTVELGKRSYWLSGRVPRERTERFSIGPKGLIVDTKEFDSEYGLTDAGTRTLDASAADRVQELLTRGIELTMPDGKRLSAHGVRNAMTAWLHKQLEE